ncbi:MAG: hypothetical protein VKJ06_00625 [Vampirovibrionales bacterium]|nr:hypothetical protein [Vampirovibrionales bacterium]
MSLSSDEKFEIEIEEKFSHLLIKISAFFIVILFAGFQVDFFSNKLDYYYLPIVFFCLCIFSLFLIRFLILSAKNRRYINSVPSLLFLVGIGSSVFLFINTTDFQRSKGLDGFSIYSPDDPDFEGISAKSISIEQDMTTIADKLESIADSYTSVEQNLYEINNKLGY